MAACKTSPRNSAMVAKSQMSKKPFIRLLSLPSDTMASNFSAMAVSRL
jgi:hypothetical protein